MYSAAIDTLRWCGKVISQAAEMCGGGRGRHGMTKAQYAEIELGLKKSNNFLKM